MTKKQDTRAHEIPVVAIGASAGGVEALERFFQFLPDDTGAAYVVAQHLKPDAVSQLGEILARHTSMPVKPVGRRQRVRANHVYVLKPGSVLYAENGYLQPVRADTGERPRTPVDQLFRSLAASHGSLTIGVILSGSGSDGSLGVKAIKEAGGIVLVQAPSEASYSGMPQSAVRTLAVDRVLGIEELVPTIADYLHRLARLPEEHDEKTLLSDRERAEILNLIQRDSGRDFRAYKPRMLTRRILRRMALANLNTPADYSQHLKSHPEELDRLCRDLMVSVTQFFRDPEAFEALKRHILPHLVRDAGPEDPLRVWVPACATGEEVYSIAILIMEVMEAEGHYVPLQIFATDIDVAALKVGRAGVYPQSIEADVSASRLRRYFERVDDQYRVRKAVRESVVFAQQDVLADPPYSRLNLISCRNLLIYLDTPAQQRLLTLLHFALREGGHLFLGDCETIGEKTDLFAEVFGRHSLFKRLATPVRQGRNSLAVPHYARAVDIPRTAPKPIQGTNRVERLAEQLILRELLPATALVNRKGELLYTYGDTQSVLGLPMGRQHLDFVEMAAEELRPTLRTVLHKAQRGAAEAAFVSQMTSTDGTKQAILITARELRHPVELNGLLLVSFRPTARRESVAGEPTSDRSDERHLSEELRITRDELQDKIQALEAANEDLKGSNEEILSMNEELQSTNEELETSQEEMQSLNEELTTVNSELQSKVDALESANDDMVNLVNSTDVATLFLDRDFAIKRYTPAIKPLLSLIGSDIGRPLADIHWRFEDPRLLADADAVLSDLQARVCEVRSGNNRWYLRRCVPYRASGDVIEGVIVTFTDISELKQAQLRALASERRWRTLADSVPVMIAYVENDGTIAFANAAMRQTLGVSESQIQDLALTDLLHDHHGQPFPSELATAQGGQTISFDARLNAGDESSKIVAVTLIPDDTGPADGAAYYAVFVDISERSRQQDQMLAHIKSFAETYRQASMGEMAAALAHQLNQPLGTLSNYAACLKQLDGTDKTRLRELSEKIEQQAQAAATVVHNLREFVSPDTEDWRSLDVNEAVQRALALSDARIDDAHATVETHFAETLPRVYGSPVLLEQVLVNLVINAVEAMAESDRRHLVATTAASADGQAVEIHIQDTGPGFTAETSARLFQPMQSTKAAGFGMGLAVAATIVEEHGGQVWARSTPEGAIFSLRLPAESER